MAKKPEEKKDIKKVAAEEIDLDSLPSEEAEAEGEEAEVSASPEAEEATAEGSDEAPVESPEAEEEAAAEGEGPEVSEEPEETIAEVGSDEVEPLPDEEAAASGEEDETSEEAEEEAEAEGSDEPPVEDPAPVAAPVAASTKKTAPKPAPKKVKAEEEPVVESPEAEEEAAAEGEEPEVSEEPEAEADAEGEEAEVSEEVPPEAVAADTLDEMVVEPIVPVDFSDRTANFEFLLCNAETKNPHWLILSKGEPVGKIALLDQETPEDIREAFCADAYADSLTETIASDDPKAVFENVRARFYHSMVRKADALQQIEKETETKVTGRLAEANDKYNEKLMGNMLLAVKADAKNFFADPNPFKAALIHEFKKAGVANAQDIVEETFLNHAESFFKRTLDKAAEWNSFAPEAMQQIQASIEGAGHRSASYDQEELRREAATETGAPRRGVPLTTYGGRQPAQKVVEAAAASDQKDHYRSVIRGIRRR